MKPVRLQKLTPENQWWFMYAAIVVTVVSILSGIIFTSRSILNILERNASLIFIGGMIVANLLMAVVKVGYPVRDIDVDYEEGTVYYANFDEDWDREYDGHYTLLLHIDHIDEPEEGE